jgi:hypothetical protein
MAPLIRDLVTMHFVTPITGRVSENRAESVVFTAPRHPAGDNSGPSQLSLFDCWQNSDASPLLDSPSVSSLLIGSYT